MDELPDEVPSPKDSLREWREQILNWVLYGLAFFGVFAVVGGLKLRLDDGRVDFAVLYLLGYGLILLAAFVHRLGFVPRALILLGALYVFAVSGFVLRELVSVGPVFLFAAVAMTTILFGLRWGAGRTARCV